MSMVAIRRLSPSLSAFPPAVLKNAINLLRFNPFLVTATNTTGRAIFASSRKSSSSTTVTEAQARLELLGEPFSGGDESISSSCLGTTPTGFVRATVGKLFRRQNISSIKITFQDLTRNDGRGRRVGDVSRSSGVDSGVVRSPWLGCRRRIGVWCGVGDLVMVATNTLHRLGIRCPKRG